MQNGVFCIPERRAGIYTHHMYNATAYSAASATSPLASTTISRRNPTPEKPLSVPAFGLTMGRRSLSGWPIGGIAKTQEVLDFCGQHNISADVEVIPMQKVDEAYERPLNGDVKYRCSIDMASLKSE
jgi:D-arabinose 1-dehydrogenase-like Zn-dependent alcohol dehydrogenase